MYLEAPTQVLSTVKKVVTVISMKELRKVDMGKEGLASQTVLKLLKQDPTSLQTISCLRIRTGLCDIH